MWIIEKRIFSLFENVFSSKYYYVFDMDRLYINELESRWTGSKTNQYEQKISILDSCTNFFSTNTPEIIFEPRLQQLEPKIPLRFIHFPTHPKGFIEYILYGVFHRIYNKNSRIIYIRNSKFEDFFFLFFLVG